MFLAPLKRRLFSQLLAPDGGLPPANGVVVELGLGTFPNAPYLAEALAPRSEDAKARPRGIDLVGAAVKS